MVAYSEFYQLTDRPLRGREILHQSAATQD